MWKCEECGCLEIFPVLDFCPQCKAPKPSPEEVAVAEDEAPAEEAGIEDPAALEPDRGIQEGEAEAADPGPQAPARKGKSSAKG